MSQRKNRQGHHRRGEARGRAMRAHIPLLEYLRWPRLRRPIYKHWLLNFLRLVELFCWVMLFRLLIALSAVTVVVLACLLVAAMVVGGPALLRSLADFMTDTFREVFTLCSQFLQDPVQARLFDMARRGTNM
ncbi:uncharacterized protein LOC119437211 [Dermacentor silvarum]|uniref:uncharacterized protein LOC119437211 n=1 Tax=Dermacentor silvarum TaxID=543639 RepID=UPI0018970C3F|nr:uncharacterized protein LOC119437211 [Dermacentor silvarum]